MQPRANTRASWPSSDDQTIFNLIVIALGAGAGLYLLWIGFHGPISAAVMDVRHWEIRQLRLFTDRFDVADGQMMRANPYRVTLHDLYGISHAIGIAWRFPACVFMLLLAAVCTVGAVPSRYKRVFDLDRLSQEQSLTFRSATAFLGRKLGLVAPADGDPRPAGYALTAEEWIARYALDARGRYDEILARAALVRQLGPRWSGPEQASPAAQVLFVAFALHLSEHREDAIDILGSASLALACDKTEDRAGPQAPLAIPSEVLARIAPFLANRQTLAEGNQVASAHAYATPALMSLLNVARRRRGVIAPAQFAWLKLVDRPLWYALHTLGFETEGTARYLHPNPRVEALGARDHWAVECAAGGPVHEPDVTRALAALRRHVPRVIVRPIGQHHAGVSRAVRSASGQNVADRN
jgi:intracellular multiplication protein IcmP